MINNFLVPANNIDKLHKSETKITNKSSTCSYKLEPDVYVRSFRKTNADNTA